MIKKFKQGIRTIWQKIKDRVDFEHMGLHIRNYTNLFLSTIGVAFFGFVAFMEYCYFPILQADMDTSPFNVQGDPMGALFLSWPMISFYISMVISMTGMAWSLHSFVQSFSFWDDYHRRVIELRARINDVESGIGGNGKQNEWLLSLQFQDSDEARKVANFVFLGRQLGFRHRRMKEIVEATFGKE